MKREIYDEDHEAFRASVKEFLDREVTPHLETYAGNHGLDRDFWLAAGKQGFLGLEIPEEYGGSEAGDYRFNAVLTEELAKVNMTLPSCVGIHADITVALPRPPHQRRAAGSAGCRGSATGELRHGHRHDRARRRLRPRQPPDHRGPRRRRLGDQRLQDLHHQRRLGRHGASSRPAPARRRRPRASRSSPSTPRWTASASAACSTRSARTSPTPPSCRSRTCASATTTSIGPLDTGFISMMQFLPQERLGSAITNLAHAKQILEETVQYAKDRQAFGQPIGIVPEQPSSCSPTWSPASRSPRRSSTSASSRTPEAS